MDFPHTLQAAANNLLLKVQSSPFKIFLLQVTLYCTMATVYRSMNFYRKAALFTHYAARVASNIAKTDQEVYSVRTAPQWSACAPPSSYLHPLILHAHTHTYACTHTRMHMHARAHTHTHTHTQAHNLLRECLPGYKLSLNLEESTTAVGKYLHNLQVPSREILHTIATGSKTYPKCTSLLEHMWM